MHSGIDLIKTIYLSELSLWLFQKINKKKKLLKSNERRVKMQKNMRWIKRIFKHITIDQLHQYTSKILTKCVNN